MLDCEIIQSKRVDKLRCLSSHVTIDARDKDKAFDAATWPGEVPVRPWRVFNKGTRFRFNDQHGSD